MNPFAAATLAWQTTFVFTLRSLQLWTEPAAAQARLAAYALEKQKAFAAGAVAAGQAALSGAAAYEVMEAALAPARRRVHANARTLMRR
ncbi:hypothetical protein [Paracraurococcus ruber]|uniref:Antifreeze protein n=1 Tax=Paracraurococcus ruber TaxID=77675 RepID=A0ABS1CU38_9PROT|nr:hypothetical protein [Paracraurococcus ruber]MBK1658001.1 hypothetical protein [Paracraurococcus ruber]TDG33809.1 hypothetical protein E2C05_02040 [Paracraurococcus ruber]